MTRLVGGSPWTDLPWQRFVELLFWEIRRRIHPSKLDEWEADMTAPLLSDVAGGGDDRSEFSYPVETLDQLVADGRALDRVDAQHVLDHQWRMAEVTDTGRRLELAREFSDARVAGLRARGLIPSTPPPPAPTPEPPPAAPPPDPVPSAPPPDPDPGGQLHLF